MVHQPARDARNLGDLFDPHVLVRAIGKKLRADVEQLRAPLLSVPGVFRGATIGKSDYYLTPIQ